MSGSLVEPHQLKKERNYNSLTWPQNARIFGTQFPKTLYPPQTSPAFERESENWEPFPFSLIK